MSAGPETVALNLRRHAAAFRAAGLETPELDVRLLLGMAMARPGLSLTLHGEELLGSGDAAAMDRLARRRLDGEPVARILGHREFWGMDFALGPDTLVPRPDSESVVEAALAALGARSSLPLTIIDLGTGSGCLLVAMLHECRAATGIGVDVSPGALSQARANAGAAGVGGRALWLASGWGQAFNLAADLVVSNPPYVPSGDIAGLAVEVWRHDPPRALDGGGDGLDAYRELAQALPGMLKPEGVAVLEIGAGQKAPVVELMRLAGLMHSASCSDLGGHERALVFRPAPPV